jgi:hypothetical protein
MATASQENRRRAVRAKGKVLSFDSADQTSALGFTTTATLGTFSTAVTSAGALKIDVNGTTYKVALYTV